jgi:hypothetical protein
MVGPAQNLRLQNWGECEPSDMNIGIYKMLKQEGPQFQDCSAKHCLGEYVGVLCV